MATQVQFRGGTTAQNNAFTGASKELTVDTDKDVVVVHDGSTAGGHPLMAEDGSNSALALGSAGTPALKFTDTNTGIYSPGPDQIALSTGGTGRLFVNSSGNVGIGTSSPASILHTSGSSDQTVTIQTTTAGADSRINFRNSGGTDAGGIFYKHNGNSLLFLGGGSNTERMRIDSSGNVGISESSPSSHSAGTGMPTLVLKGNSGSYAARSGGLAFVSQDGVTAKTFIYHDTDLNFQSATATNINFLTSNIQRLRIASDGRATFANDVRIDGGTTSVPALLLTADNNAGKGLEIRNAGNSLNVDIGVNGDAYFAGNVGIGTTSPNNKLEIKGSNGGYSFRVDAETSPVTIRSEDNTGAVYGAIRFTAGNGSTETERMRIDSSGRLLVGTSSASVFTFGGITPRLQVEGTDASTGTAVIARNSNDANGAGLIISKSRGTTAGSNTIVSNNDTIADLRFEAADGTQKAIAASISAQVDGTPGTNDMPGRLVFSTCADGSSSPTTRMTIKNDGTINFANVQTFADDAAAGSGGLVSGDVYKTSAGDLKIKA